MINPYIRTFIAVAETGSLSAAAEKIYLSKVSVKNQIDALEAQIGVALLSRTKQGTSLTDAGEVFYARTCEMLRFSERALSETREAGGVISHTIRIATSVMHPWSDLMDLWAPFEASHPEIEFEIIPFSDDSNSLARIAGRLGQNIDCFVTPNPYSATQELGFFPIREIRCMLTMAKDHPLADKPSLSWEDLKGQTILLPKAGTSMIIDAIRMEALTKHEGVRIADFDGAYDLSVFNLCRKQGFLVEMPEVWGDIHHSLVSLPVDWNYTMPYGIIYAKEPPRSVRTFIDILSQKQG